MIGWESSLKVGNGFDVFLENKKRDLIRNNEIGYAIRYFYKNKIIFHSSSNPLKINDFSNEEISDFFLPDTLYHFEPKIKKEIDLNSVEEILLNFKKELASNYKRFEIARQKISYSYFYFELKNSSGANVSLKNFSLDGSFLLKKDNFFINLPFLSNLDLSISFSDYLLNVEPYLHLPLPLFEFKPSRFPVLIYPYTLFVILEYMTKYFLKGSIPELPENFILKDVPYHPKSPNYFPVDGEGSLKEEFIIKKGNIPLDSFNGFLHKKKTTSNSMRNSIYNPPNIGFHNILFEGPENHFKFPESFISLTYPLKIEEYPPYFILKADGFYFKNKKPAHFCPSIIAKFTMDDFFSNFYFIKKPLLFYSSTFSIGVPFLFLKGLSIYPIL